MSQDDDQKRDPKDQSEGTREARGDSSPADSEQSQTSPRPDQGSDLDEVDDTDEDRDDDERGDGGPDRRNNIG